LSCDACQNNHSNRIINYDALASKSVVVLWTVFCINWAKILFAFFSFQSSNRIIAPPHPQHQLETERRWRDRRDERRCVLCFAHLVFFSRSVERWGSWWRLQTSWYRGIPVICFFQNFKFPNFYEWSPSPSIMLDADYTNHNRSLSTLLFTFIIHTWTRKS
jgi:hypothetical protein